MEEGIMTFERSWVLLLLALPPAFAVWQWRTGVAKVNVLLKALTFVAIIAALAEPRMEVNETKVAATVLVDTSASIPAEDLQRASKLISEIDSARGRHWMRVMPFARGSRTLSPAEEQKGWRLQRTAGDAG